MTRCSASCRLSPGGPAVLRQADRAVAEFRGAGGHRDGERAADRRDARGLGAADRDRRGVAGHQFLARRPRAGVRCDAGKGDAAVRGGIWTARRIYEQAFSHRGDAGMPARILSNIGATTRRLWARAPNRRAFAGERIIHVTDMMAEESIRRLTQLVARWSISAESAALDVPLRGTSVSVSSTSTARRSGRFPTSRSPCCRISRRRRSSRSRTHGCSTNCASAPTNWRTRSRS